MQSQTRQKCQGLSSVLASQLTDLSSHDFTATGHETVDLQLPQGPLQKQIIIYYLSKLKEQLASKKSNDEVQFSRYDIFKRKVKCEWFDTSDTATPKNSHYG